MLIQNNTQIEGASKPMDGLTDRQTKEHCEGIFKRKRLRTNNFPKSGHMVAAVAHLSSVLLYIF